MDIVSKKWSLVILLEIYKGNNGKKRFSEIKKSLQDITPKILSIRLKDLEKQGLISKNIDSSQVPIKCEYKLTKSGIDFINIIKNIKSWALKWMDHRNLCEQLDCKECKL